MPLSAQLARFNRRVTNPVLGTVAPYVPPMAVVVHTGRKSGHPYATPVLAFPTDRGFVIALTYGPDTDWVRNVVAGKGCLLLRGGRRYRMGRPVIMGVDGLPLLPAPIRPAMTLLNVGHVLRLERERQVRARTASSSEA